jgi:hypothetical protein
VITGVIRSARSSSITGLMELKSNPPNNYLLYH